MWRGTVTCAVQRFLFAARPMRPTEPGMAEGVRALQDPGFPMLALIARDPQAIGATRRKLSRNGFDLTRTAPVAPAALVDAAIPDPHAPDPGAHQKAPPLRR
jgi:hypothetical protein